MSSKVQICVFGAGAVGGYLAGKLAESNTDEVSVVGRGEHLRAMREHGLKLVLPEGERRVHFAMAAEDPRQLPAQDIVFVTLKAHSLPGAADALRGLLKPEGHAVFVTNGIPWWWNHGLPDTAGRQSRLDPEGVLERRFGAARALGCVVYSANEVPQPGTVLHRGNNRWVLGEPGNEVTPRLEATADLMRNAGLNAEVTIDLRRQIWNKMLRNAVFNPLSALTRLDAIDFAAVPSLVDLAQQVTEEVRAVARAKGFELPPSSAWDVVRSGGAVGGKPAPIRGSMLQDVIAGRPLEVEAVLGQVQQFAREEKLVVPAIDTVYALLAGLDASRRQRARGDLS